MRDELDKELAKHSWRLAEVLTWLDEMLNADEHDLHDIAGEVRRAFLLPKALASAVALFWAGYRHGLAQ